MLPKELHHYRTILLQEPDLDFHRWEVRWLPRLIDTDGTEDGGWCQWSKRRLSFCTSVPLLRQIEFQIHEMLHATFPDLDEQAVIRAELNICRALTAAGVLPVPKKRKVRLKDA